MSAAQQRASKREARERLAASARHRRDDSSASTTLTSPGAAVSLCTCAWPRSPRSVSVARLLRRTFTFFHCLIWRKA
jgi:hypothetical protein